MDLTRFITAQRFMYDTALADLRDGRKRTHWMWFVFPQLRGLGHSERAIRYGIENLDEARAYLAHDLLGPRLRECTAAVLMHPHKSANDIFGAPDDLKFRSSMTLFARASDDPSIFDQALAIFFSAEPDARTLALLK